MLRHTLILCVLLVLTATSFGYRAVTDLQPAQEGPAVRFSAVDLVLNLPEGAELGSYQVELAPLADQPTTVRVVGIEGGEHESFRTPPFYDPKAIGNERVILAAYSTAAELPRGTTRIARVHYEISGEGELPDLAQLVVVRQSLATDRNGDPLASTLTITPSPRNTP